MVLLRLMSPARIFESTAPTAPSQALKIIRYTSRLLAAVSPPGSESRARFDALQSSIGTSRSVKQGP